MKTIKEMPLEQRPYERALKYGVDTLTDAELLAVFLRTGTKKTDVLTLAYKILNLEKRAKPLHGLLHCRMEQLLAIPGIGKVKAIQILCLGELCQRVWQSKNPQGMVVFRSPEMVADYYKERIRHLEVEELRLVFLDTKQRPLSDLVISVGTVNASLVSVREILIACLKHQAVNVLLIHNHPSGDPTPSQADIKVTKEIYKALNMVGIDLTDHIIIGDNCYFSFREQGNI